MINRKIYILLFLISYIVAGCTPRDDSLVYRPESLEPPVERPIEIDTECEGEDCPPPSNDSEVDEILVDNFDPYGSGEVGTSDAEIPESSNVVSDSEQTSNSETDPITVTE